MKITDGQVRRLRRLLDAEEFLVVAARRTGMDEKTARKYRDLEGLPSEMVKPRTWRTREDPFEEVWPEVLARLEAEPKLRPFALFGWLQVKYPGRFQTPSGGRWSVGFGLGEQVTYPAGLTQKSLQAPPSAQRQ